ncbi:hypothetical protein MPLA_2060002 [Mesorhizobium sp. ORS 3359]|nr:hypothetical protein MPLA_2060002 [Mesorhizobium sp. ORS 3359]
MTSKHGDRDEKRRPPKCKDRGNAAGDVASRLIYFDGSKAGAPSPHYSEGDRAPFSVSCHSRRRGEQAGKTFPT